MIQLFENIFRILRAGGQIELQMNSIIDLCEARRPHPDWVRFRAIRFDESARATNLVRNAFETDPPSATINGIWFGLFNPIRESRPSADLYFGGSSRFDANSENPDWAVSLDWTPADCNLNSKVLDEVYQISYGNRTAGLRNDAEFPLSFAYGSFLVTDILSNIEPSIVRRDQNDVGIAVGFDSGDSLVLGAINANGFEISNVL